MLPRLVGGGMFSPVYPFEKRVSDPIFFLLPRVPFSGKLGKIMGIDTYIIPLSFPPYIPIQVDFASSWVNVGGWVNLRILLTQLVISYLVYQFHPYYWGDF